MIDLDKAEELVATNMAATDLDENPVELTIRVLTDGTENAIEVVTEAVATTKEQTASYVISKVYIPADGPLVAMITSMQSMLPVQT